MIWRTVTSDSVMTIFRVYFSCVSVENGWRPRNLRLGTDQQRGNSRPSFRNADARLNIAGNRTLIKLISSSWRAIYATRWTPNQRIVIRQPTLKIIAEQKTRTIWEQTEIFVRRTIVLTSYTSLGVASTAEHVSSGLLKGSGNPQAIAINWTDASDDLGMPGPYGTLIVPLDYSSPQSEKNTLTLNILWVHATKGPKLGRSQFRCAVLACPAGSLCPCISYVSSDTCLKLSWERICWRTRVRRMTGGQYNNIGADPRGTGTTLPVDCYIDSEKRTRTGC